MEDSKIVELFWERDETAIYYTAEKYGHRLRRASYGIVRDHQTAEESENDTYAECWDSIPPHRPEDYLYGFLLRILRHISLNRCRERSRLKRSAYICELSAEMEQCIPAPNDCECRLNDMIFAEAINGFLESLSVEKRNLFLRRYWYLDSVNDLSRSFGYSQSKVKTTLYRLRSQLRDYLEREGYVI